MNTGMALSAQPNIRGLIVRWLVLALLIALALVGYALAVGDTAALQDDILIFAGIAGVGGLAGVLALSMGQALRQSNSGQDTQHETLLVQEAQMLRIMRERARAIYEMAITLSSTLDHRRVMEVAQDIGALSLREDLGTDTRLVSAILLFRGEEKKLRVITARGLTPADQHVALAGQRGVLGLALKQMQPIFGGKGIDDPELRYFAAFQDAKSVLAIPLGAGYDLYGVIVFGCDQPNAFSDNQVELMTAIGTQATLSLQNAVLYQNLLAEKVKIVEVEEDARKKLARDLHDGPTQSVAAIAMRANYIRRLIERQPQQAVEELWKVEELARRTTKEIRHMLFTMRPLVLENQGLVAALRQLAERMLDTHDTNVVVQATPNVETYLDTNAQGVLFYIIEEAANNARKHAQSEQIWVRLYHKDNFVVAEIEDKGVGFDVEATDADYDQRGSLGMINMRERAGLIEGQLQIQSAVGKGTKISVLVPVDVAGAARGETDVAPPLQLQSHREMRSKSAPPETPSIMPLRSPANTPASTREPEAQSPGGERQPFSTGSFGPVETPNIYKPPSLHRLPARPRTPARVPSGVFHAVQSQRKVEDPNDKPKISPPKTEPSANNSHENNSHANDSRPITRRLKRPSPPPDQTSKATPRK